MSIQALIENKEKLDYQQICTTLIGLFSTDSKVNWESVLPAQPQQEYFGGESLRLISDHATFAKQKDIRPIALKKGNISQMLFMYVCLKDENLPKKHIQQVSKKFVGGGDASRYIIWFFGNEKNTQLKVVLSAKEGKKMVLKTLAFGVNQPYYKTYNFIFEKINEQVSQFFVEPTELWKALWKSFDISVINNQFYKEIKAVFDALIKNELPKTNLLFKTEEAKVQFAIRLIGRIIFCWFLKRKGIITDEVLSAETVRRNGGSYYHELLEILFFDIFNTPEKERKAGLPKILSKYPFLNGGLFEAQPNDFKDNFMLTISNDWFYNLFAKTLERYNFTVDENSSSNAEIAIDPEMLGRIFENLLAEQNPETGESARKATGSFYTPREIVDYMVEQSTIEYLKTVLGATEIIENPIQENLFGTPAQQLALPKVIDKDLPKGWEEMIADFVHTHSLPEGLNKYEKKLIDALNKIKVLDPACGSGAFPMGVLQKIVALKQTLQPKALPYQLKLETIQNSIFGIDIQPMAVELSRLRCWLSLVVDEDINNIKALPYLDFKFVCADSLTDVPRNEILMTQSLKELSAFESATSQYFNLDYKRKDELKAQIKRALAEIAKQQNKGIEGIISKLNQERNKSTPSASKLKLREADLTFLTRQQEIWDSYKNIFEGKKVDFFSLQYFFPMVKKGFDVVIGNPPYVQLQDNGGTLAKMYESQKYKTFARMGDIYSLFYEKGIQLLVPNGILCFITSNKWMRTGYGEATRKFFAESNNPVLLIDFAGQKIFEAATVDTNILLLQKAPNKGETKACLVKENCLDKIEEYVSKNSTTTHFHNGNSWVILNPIEKSIKEKIERIGTPLKDWDINIYRGILTGYNEAFIIDGKKKEQLIAEDPKSAEVIRPILRGRDIKRYGYEFADLWLIATFPSMNYDIEMYPAIKQHLLSFGYDRLKQTGDNGARKKTNNKWFETQDSISYWENFYKQKKIIYIEIMTDNEKEGFPFPSFSFDTNLSVVLNTGYIMTSNTESLEYILAVLNSRVGRNLVKLYISQLQSRQFRMLAQYVNLFPVPKISKEQQSIFANLVTQILSNKAQNLETRYLENEIDNLVYSLFGLVDEEIEVIKII